MLYVNNTERLYRMCLIFYAIFLLFCFLNQITHKSFQNENKVVLKNGLVSKNSADIAATFTAKYKDCILLIFLNTYLLFSSLLPSHWLERLNLSHKQLFYMARSILSLFCFQRLFASNIQLLDQNIKILFNY